jgi:hypothetical protein
MRIFLNRRFVLPSGRTPSRLFVVGGVFLCGAVAVGGLRSVRLQMGGASRRSLPRGTGRAMMAKDHFQTLSRVWARFFLILCSSNRHRRAGRMCGQLRTSRTTRLQLARLCARESRCVTRLLRATARAWCQAEVFVVRRWLLKNLRGLPATVFHLRAASRLLTRFQQ